MLCASRTEMPAIRARPESLRSKTGRGGLGATAKGAERGAGSAPAASDPRADAGPLGRGPAPELASKGLGVRLWGLCSPLPLAAYAPPWKGIAAELSDRLATALAAPGSREAAASAVHLGYAGCVKALARAAPALYRALTDIRGLALAVAPPAQPAENKKASLLPGVPLVYEALLPLPPICATADAPGAPLWARRARGSRRGSSGLLEE
jgi:hypothetical protein